MPLCLLPIIALCGLLSRPAQAQTPTQAESDSLSERTKTKDVKKHYMRPGGPPTFEEEKEKFFRQLRERGKPPLEIQTAPEDSLTVKERSPLFDIDDKGLRIFAKAGAGIITSAAITAPLIGVIAWASSLDDESNGGGDFFRAKQDDSDVFTHPSRQKANQGRDQCHTEKVSPLKWCVLIFGVVLNIADTATQETAQTTSQQDRN